VLGDTPRSSTSGIDHDKLFLNISTIVPINYKDTDDLVRRNNTIGQLSMVWEEDGYVISSLRAEIVLAECLDQDKHARDFIVLHEYMHLLHHRLIPDDLLIAKKCYQNDDKDHPLKTVADRFFDMDDASELFHELSENLYGVMQSLTGAEVRFPHKGGHITLTWPVVMDDNKEMIANMGACIYYDPGLSLKKFPKAATRFLELLDSGYYGADAKTIFDERLDPTRRQS